MIIADPYTTCPRCNDPVAFLAEAPTEPPCIAVDEDSLTIRDMADIENGRPVFYEADRHWRHSDRCKDEEFHIKKSGALNAND